MQRLKQLSLLPLIVVALSGIAMQSPASVVQIFTSVGLPDAETTRAALDRADSGQFLLAGLAGYSPTLHERNILIYLTAPVTTAFVPPQLFVKTSYDFGRALSYEVYGIPDGTPTSSTVTWFGEAWLVAGWQGVVFIPLLLGLIIGAGVQLVRQLTPAMWAPTMGILALASPSSTSTSAIMPPHWQPPVRRFH